MNVLIIGSGGREHAFAWKIKQSEKCEALYMAPGNGGTGDLAVNIDINVDDFEAVKTAILTHGINMVVVGPEDPLVKGIVDKIKADQELSGVMVIGPSANGAQLEGSKDFSKAFMNKYGVPTAASQTFDKNCLEEGKAFLEELEAPYVLKVDGLAAGKGVLITEDLDEAKANLEDLLVNEKFGQASSKVLVEEYLHGIELSIFVLTDGRDYVILPEAKDYKRIGEGDTGLNTGGMGAISPVVFADRHFLEAVEEEVVKPTVKGIQEEGMDYCGFIFIGLMNNMGRPYVIEYNVRMGDPETEVVLPRIKSDFLDLLEATAKGQLGGYELKVEPYTASTVILVSGGYPEAYEKGKEITFSAPLKSIIPFHAGTKKDEAGRLVTNGGRVMALTGLGKNLSEALNQSYHAAELVKWEGMNFRKDIGADLQKLGQ